MPELIDGHLVQLNSLPLPSAALVLDVRGVQDDDVTERLRVEIADLASEMQAYEINHWRHLPTFLSFLTLERPSVQYIDALKKQKQPQQSADQTATTESGLFPWTDDSNPDAPFDTFKQRVDALTLEIDRVRRNRIVAFQDLSKTGRVGQTRRDPTVRVMFVTDANNPQSLSSAAIYASQFRERFRQRERPGQPPLVHLSVLCLDNKTEENATRTLVEHLCWEGKWEHLDAIFINEQYNAEGALLTGPIQTYLAELILYVMLLIPPLNLLSETLQTGADLAQDEQSNGQASTLDLPPTTYTVGMATIEHSARWGHRWLNYSLATSMIQMLQDKKGASQHEEQLAHTQMEKWFQDWRAEIITAIPDKVPANIPGLKAIPNAERAVKNPDEVFPDQRLAWKMTETSLQALQEHHQSLLTFYEDPEPTRNLQAAIDSIPAIEQRLRDWEERDPAFKKGTPLVSAQDKAQNILGKHMTTSRGAIPRAGMQLRELNTIINTFRNHLGSETIDIPQQCKDLKKQGEASLKHLDRRSKMFPLFASLLHLQRPMVFFNVLWIVVLVMIVIVLGLGEAANIMLANNINSPALGFILGLLENNSFGGSFIWLLLIVVDLGLALYFTRTMWRNKYSALGVEVICLVLLLLTFVCSLVFDLALSSLLSGDRTGIMAAIAWIKPFGVVLGALFLIVAMIETIYFVIWRRAFLRDRDVVLARMNQLHQQNIQAVKEFIANSIALEILVRTGLTDPNGGNSPYQKSIIYLQKSLNDILVKTQAQQKMASRRLGSSMSSVQPVSPARSRASGEWLRLRIREEYLDIPTLVDGYKRLQSFLEKDNDQVRRFTELLLRIMGQEVPAQIEQQFRAKTPLTNYDQHQARLLLEVMVSIILRFAQEPDSIGSLSAIHDRYETLKDGYLRELPVIGVLINSLDQQISHVTISPIPNEEQEGMLVRPEDRLQLATEALATWGQVLWDHQDPRLDGCLSRQGVLAKLMTDPDYDPLALMRQIGVRVTPFANSLRVGQQGEGYLLLSPSDQSRRFRQSLNIDSTSIHVTEFPDNERLLLFSIQRYVSPLYQNNGGGQAALGPGAAALPALPPGNPNASQGA